MRKSISFWMLGIVAMLASCSQNEELLQGTSDNNGTATFTVALDESMKTRAVGDDDNTGLSLTAYVLDDEGNIVQTPKGTQGETTDDGNLLYTFTVSGLPTEGTYRIVCWAYNAEEYTADATTNLTLTAADGNPGIAYYGNTGTDAQKIADMDKNIPMTHAVGKVTLVTTKSLEAGRSAELSVPTYKAFNLLDGTVVTGDDATTTATATSEEGAQVTEGTDGATLCSVYVLCGSEVTDGVTVTTLDNDEFKTINNVPVKPNVHVILKGDANLGIGGDVDFTAEIATNWENDTEQAFTTIVNPDTHTIILAEAGSLTTALIEKAVAGETDITLTISGPMNDVDAMALKYFFDGEYGTKETHVSTLDMSGVTGLTEIKDATFRDARYLKKVILPASVTSIASRAFAGAGLETFTAEHVTSVGDESAFGSCTNLTELSLPSVTTFGEGNFALAYCTSLTTLKLTSPEFDGVFGPNFFSNTPTENVDLYIHKNLKDCKLTLQHSDGSISYAYYHTSNPYTRIDFKSITLVDDNGDPVDESTL